MQRILITGASGFVGMHLLNLLKKMDVELWGTSRRVPFLHLDNNITWSSLNLEILKDVADLITTFKPNIVFHLAGQSNVKKSWEDTIGTFQSNVIGTINLFDAIVKNSPDTKIITVGSSEEYGVVNEPLIPIKENIAPNPTNPYGLSKLTIGNLAIQYYKAYGLRVIHARPFNHIGRGQAEGFVTTDFAKQIVSIEMGMLSNPISVGNLSAERDFTDVRDIVSAYWALAATGKEGEVYNICTGKGTKISTILNELANRSHARIQIIQDPNKFRPLDIPVYIGNNEKLKEHTNWLPKFDLSDTLDDIIDDWRIRVKGV